MFARYAFNELWSFVAGWAILLDYLIVMAIAAFITPHYLAVFWGGADDGLPQIAISGAVIAYVAWQNFRGLSAERYRYVLRLSLVGFVLFGVIVIVGLAQLWEPSLLTDAGPAPEWEDLVFAAVIATVACTGIEAASGLAGELRVGREGLRRVVEAAAVGVLVVFVGVSLVALMAVPVAGRDHAARRRVRGRAGAGGGGGSGPRLARGGPAVRGRRGGRPGPDTGGERPDAGHRPAGVLAGHQPPDPEHCSRACTTSARRPT